MFKAKKKSEKEIHNFPIDVFHHQEQAKKKRKKRKIVSFMLT